MATTIIHGPAGCGKTRNRDALAKRYAGHAAAFVDEWDERQPLQRGNVHLALTAPSQIPPGVRVMSFAQAMQGVR